MFAKTLGFAVEYLSSSYWHALSKNLKESEENKDQKLQYHLDNRLAFILCFSIVVLLLVYWTLRRLQRSPDSESSL